MSFTRPKHPARVVTVVVLLLVAVNVALWGGLAQENGPANVQRPQAIADLQPAEGERILPQGPVGAALDPKYTGQLAIDGRNIPDDQLEKDLGLNELLFKPGTGKEFVEWKGGRHRAVVEYWPREDGTLEAARQKGTFRAYSWEFNVG